MFSSDREERRATAIGTFPAVMAEPARLVDEDHGVGRRAVEEAQRHRRVGGVVERALALHEDPVTHLLGSLHEPLGGAIDEVGDDAVDSDAPALDHDARLPGGHEDGRETGPERRRAELERHAHLADGAVGADGEDDVAAGAVRPPGSDLVAFGWPPMVDQLDAVRGGEGGELGILADELVQSRDDVEAGLDGGHDRGPPVGRDPAALRRDADEERRGPPGGGFAGQGVGEGRDDGDVAARARATRGRCARPGGCRAPRPRGRGRT